jgi:drug/metabolite transporter (DMT)-like permease
LRNLVAALIALAAAALFGLGNALEHREVQVLDEPDSIRLSLIGKLAKRRRWLMGFGCDVGAYALHATALGIGALVLVQPMLPLNLLFALPLSAHWAGRPFTARQWTAAIVLCASIGIFIFESAPGEGASEAPLRNWFPVLVAGALVIALSIAAAQRFTGASRATLLGIASGVCFGLNSALSKSFVHLIPQGVGVVLTHWEPYALAVTSILGLVLIQSMFQRAELGAGLPVNETLEPLIAAGIGIVLFHESIDAHSAWGNMLVALAIVGMFVCVTRLAREANDLYEDVAPPLTPHGLGAG